MAEALNGGAVGEWSLAGLYDVVAEAVPDRVALTCGPTRRTYAGLGERTRSIAAWLGGQGLGLHRARAELAPWEKGQDTVALVMSNGAEYVETMLGAYRARAVPANVNHHYRPAEARSLLQDLEPRAVVYHRRYGPLVEAACDVAAAVLVDVDDGSGVAPLPGSTPFEAAATSAVDGALPEPSPDDLYLVCTGGTTGRPKAVLWRQADIYVAAMGGREGATRESIAKGAGRNLGGPWFAVPPLMHAAAQWTTFAGLLGGAGALLHDDSEGFDAAEVLGLAARERASWMSIVGDAHALPIVDELRRTGHDLAGLGAVGTGGAAMGEHLKDALLALLPHLMIVDGYGASETGSMAHGARSASSGESRFSPAAGGTVVSADRTRFLAPGDDEVGWTARAGHVPLGYLGDRERTEATFPTVEGVRVAVPGDRAQLLADGTIRLLGRDATVINTGGEKVFAEEVEAVLRTHGALVDALVVGRPSERFGQEVVAVVAPRHGARVDPAELREFVAAAIARYKAPRAVVVCDAVRRLANGKADYEWAREQALAATTT